MTDEQRVEAAARAMVKLGVTRRAAGKQIPTRYEEAQEALRSAYPELYGDKPSHWLAPWEATQEMLEAALTTKKWFAGVFFESGSYVPWMEAYRAMRTAHLAKDQEP